MIRVKVMQSYDYNHFEVCLGTEDEPDYKKANELRKTAQRLTDEAIRQYKIAKELARKKDLLVGERNRLLEKVLVFKNSKPSSEWTAEEKAQVKALEDYDYWTQYDYDYEDEDEENEI